MKYYIGVAERYIAGPLFLNLMTKLIHLPDVKAVAVRAFLPVNLRGAAVKIALRYTSKACSDSLHAGSEARLAVIYVTYRRLNTALCLRQCPFRICWIKKSVNLWLTELASLNLHPGCIALQTQMHCRFGVNLWVLFGFNDCGMVQP